MIERIQLYKIRISIAAELASVSLALFYKSYFIKEAKLLKDNNFADVNLEFQEAVLPVVEIAFIVGRLVQFLLLLLSFKWPWLVNGAYATELIVLAIWNLVPTLGQSQHVNLTFYLMYVMSITHSMVQPKFDIACSIAFFACFMCS